MMFEAFTAHPRAIGETWDQHRRAAWSFAGPLALATFACLVHGVLPWMHERTASRTILALNYRLHRRAPHHSNAASHEAEQGWSYSI